MVDKVTDSTSEAWLSTYHPSPGSQVRLVCFAHAGGAASFWYPFSTALQPDVEVVAVQYPGRHERMREKPLTDLHLVADRVAEALAATLPGDDRPYALLGHSYGAVVAYEVARRLREAPGNRPAALFVSGRRAPDVHRDDRLHLAPDARLVAELRSLSGTGGSLLDDPDVLAMILPALRADYRAIETYRYRPGPALDIPITAIIGDADPKVTPEEADIWRDHTTAGFDLEVMPGDHFYLSANQASLVRLLRGKLTTRV